MAPAALLLAAALAASAGEPVAEQRRGIELASARVAVEILQPAAVRQGSGPERSAPDAPTPQITRREGRILVEYQ